MGRDVARREGTGLAEMIGPIAHDAGRLVGQHLELLRAEVREGLSEVVPAVASIGAGAGLVATGGILGSMMALEAIREIVGFGEGLVGRLLMLDARNMRFETLRYAWDPANLLTGEAPTIRDLSAHA